MLGIGLVMVSLKQIITMFLIIFVGIVCYKTKIIDKKGNSALSAVVLNIVNPAVIFISYQKDFDMELLKGLGYALILSALSFFVVILVVSLIIRKKPNSKWNIERIAVIYSNSGFIGIPLVNALVGSIGVFYLAAYLTCFNLLLWTHGVMLMKKLSGAKEILKNVLSPCVIAIFLGIICFVLKIRLFGSLYNAVDAIADMNTPLAMLVAGITIAQTDFLKALKKGRIYFMCFLKLFLTPIITCFLLFFFKKIGVALDVLMTIIIATACPTGASGTLFAIRYNGDELYASEIFAITTIFSAISIPVIMLFVTFLFG